MKAAGAQPKISAFFKKKEPVEGPASSKAQRSTRQAEEQPNDQPVAKRPRVASEPAPAQTPAAPPRQAPIPIRDNQRAAKAHRKLVTNKDGDAFVLDPTTTTTPHRHSQGASGKVKFTPLEQQVVELKAKNPGVLLLVEVGYKFRMFGEDAEVGARICNIYAFPDHNFLTCGFPVFRLPVYVRRLVNAGYKVGVVRQVETAAIKSQSASRNAPFERKLTALFTAATLDAGQRADKAGEEGSLEEFAEIGEASVGTVQKYILFVAEAPPTSTHAPDAPSSIQNDIQVVEISDDDEGRQPGEAKPAPPAATSRGQGAGGRGAGRGAGGRGARGRKRGASSDGKGSKEGGACGLALLAVEPSTGDVQLGLASGSGMSGVHSDGQLELEAVLLSLSPAELVVLEPVSNITSRMLQAYVSTTPGCRLERLRGWGPTTSAADLNRQLKALYSAGPDSESHLPVVQRLPRHAQLTLAAASHHLESFGLEGVLQLRTAPSPPAPGSPSPSTTAQGDKGQRGSGGLGADADADMAGLICAAGLQPMQRSRCMHLGPNALRQLDVLVSSDDGQFRGSLLYLLDRTHTAAGGRLLRAWVSSPMTDAGVIGARLDAVEELAGVKGARGAGPLSRLPDTLRRLPDLERGLTRLLHRTAPPSELVATLSALKEIPSSLGLQYDHATQELLELPPGAVMSPLLSALLAAAAAPDVHMTCTRILSCLDIKAAKHNRTADCLTDPDQFEDVVKAKQEVQDALDELQSLLPGLAKELNIRALEYVSIQNQGDWLIEVPVEMERRVPKTWSRVCGTKKVGRYHPPSVSQAMLQLAISREQLDLTAINAYNRFLRSFTPHYSVCKAAASALAQLDALNSLAAVARSPGFSRPVVLPVGACAPQLIIRGGRHPMLDAHLEARTPLQGGAGGEGAGRGAAGAVPNDVVLDSRACRAAVITGPNMGGKSCLVRAAALIAIMAQIGSYVPAESCRMTALDGVYTRMGASDNLMLGRSTFMEELGDAAHILEHATNRSLVIMDELGRGTATHDGVAIATATLSHLVSHIQCLSLFVTHYPEVAQMACGHPHVRAYHMAYVRDDEEDQDDNRDDIDQDSIWAGRKSDKCDDPEPPRITFLYKLQEGAADQSFGLNVARMAGLPQHVVVNAAKRASSLHQSTSDHKAIGTAKQVVAMLRRVRTCMDDNDNKTTPAQMLKEVVELAWGGGGGGVGRGE